tara:strand:+ start:434 stop:874 length:441 start_codon:yes stop_codon:yes gene_type:complete
MGGTNVTILAIERLCSKAHTGLAHGSLGADIPVVTLSIVWCEHTSAILTAIRRAGVSIVTLKCWAWLTDTVHARILGRARVAIVTGADRHAVGTTTVSLATIDGAWIAIITENIPKTDAVALHTAIVARAGIVVVALGEVGRKYTP